MSYRYYECSFRKNRDCKARLKIKNKIYTVTGYHCHEKPKAELFLIKEKIENAAPSESNSMIKERIIAK